jgi:hypothetical protein
VTTWQFTVLAIVLGANGCGVLWLAASWVAVWHDGRWRRRDRRRKRRDDWGRSRRVQKLQRELAVDRKLKADG